MGNLLGAVICFLAFSPFAIAVQPTWAKKAVAFPSQCEIGSVADATTGVRTALQDLPKPGECKPVSIPSPDRKFIVDVKYEEVEIEKGYRLLQAYFLLRAKGGTTRRADFPLGFQNIDLLWALSSKSIFVNGGNGGGYWGFWVYVYQVDNPKLEPIDVTAQARRDMVQTFPPCRASQLDEKVCHEMEKGPSGYNMSGIDWGAGSSSIIVMAEVPCSGGSGGIMCQVMGYELEVPTSRILRRMTAREFKHEWQKSMAFRFEDPGPAEYCEKGNPNNIPGCIGHDW